MTNYDRIKAMNVDELVDEILINIPDDSDTIFIFGSWKNRQQIKEYLESEVEGITDHLIANGVICTPCKVGDKVYFDTYLHGDSVGVQSHKVINVKYVITTEPSKGGIGAEIPDYAFGETVFLTREEAEKALERSKG